MVDTHGSESVAIDRRLFGWQCCHGSLEPIKVSPTKNRQAEVEMPAYSVPSTHKICSPWRAAERQKSKTKSKLNEAYQIISY